METYKRTINNRIYLLALVVLIAVALGIFDAFFATAEIKSSVIFSFQCGLTSACGLIALAFIARYKRALSDEKNIKLLFNKENDERMKAIKYKAGIPMLLVTSVLMIISAVIIGYFNVTAFYTLIAASLCQLVLSCIVKFVYIKRS